MFRVTKAGALAAGFALMWTQDILTSTAVQPDVGRITPIEVSFDPSSQRVTLKVAVEDPRGRLISTLRPDNFVVYDNGTKQTHPSVDVEHALLSLAVLVEGGGRYQELNEILNTQIPQTVQSLRDVVLPGDQIEVFSYSDSVKAVLEAGESRRELDTIPDRLRITGFSEANLYDALVEIMDRAQTMQHRRAVVLVSTGLDSFSHTTFDAMLAKARRSDTPVYCIGLAGLVQHSIIGKGPLSRIDWNRAIDQLNAVARATNGRAYRRDTDLDVPAIYDDFMEHLRVRYVITYIASGAPTHATRTVRLIVTDPTGSAIPARMSAEARYTR